MENVEYISTNRQLPHGERPPFTRSVGFSEALFMGQAPDFGLFMPTRFPAIDRAAIPSWAGLPYHEVAYRVLRAFLGPLLPESELRQMMREAYPFDIPLEQLANALFLMRLDQGPTASFKDFAARLMARLMARLRPDEAHRIVLVATSGDTGSAVGEAFRDVSGFDVVILYPEGDVSPLQKHQLDSIGRNVRSVSVDGTFDDCQRLAKMAFSDPDLDPLHLTSANSINIGRLLPQMVYYVYAYVNLVQGGGPVRFSIPSGNFGNALGCAFAARMGLPVQTILTATNANDAFPRFMESGVYQPVRPSKACLSNAMNVGNPSNLARLFDLYGGTLDRDGKVHVPPDLTAMQNDLTAVSITDAETVATIRKTHSHDGRVLEPHGAVAVTAACRLPEDDIPTICLETAAPFKFGDWMEIELGIQAEIPDALRAVLERPATCDRMSGHYDDLKQYLLQKKGSHR